MIRITLRRTVGTLAVIAGLLAAAAPAGAQGGGADSPSVITMLDYEGAAVRGVSYNGHAGLILMADSGGQYFANGVDTEFALVRIGS